MKRILSLMLCFVMVFGTLATVPAFAEPLHNLIVSADKTEAAPGDVINFTISLDSSSLMGSLQMQLDIPEGLTYVAGSGKLADGLKEKLGYDSLDWTEVSLMVNGFASAGDYETDTAFDIATFQCSVDEGFSGSAEVGLYNLEFASCQDFEIYTDLYNLVPVEITVGGGSGSSDVVLDKYDLAVLANKTEVVPGDTVDFTIMFGPVDTLGSLQMQLDIPEGLTYVAGSGKLADGLKEKMGYDSLDWTEQSLIINGFASAGDYASDENTTVATFQCTVDEGFSGTAVLDLTYLEFCSCLDFENYTHLFTIKPATLQGPQPSTYDLTFVTDGSAVAAVEDQEPGTVVDLSSYTTTKDGYRFMGWYADEARETPVTSVTLDADTTVYAKFVKEYTLTYVVDGATDEEVVGVEGQVITLKAVPAKSGYDVLGWFVNGAGEAVTTVTLNSDVTVEAKYEYIPVQYTITFMVDGTEYGTFKVGENKTLVLATAMENPTKAGYRFDGWELDGTIVTEVYGDGDKTVEAQFVKQYTLTITADGFATETQTVDVDTVIDLSTNVPEKEYWIFTGWTLDGAPVTSVTMDADKEVIASYVEAVAIVDDVEFATLDEAVAALADGSEMKLYKDITTDAAITIDEDAVIDLGDNKVTSTADAAFAITGDATIKNGAIDADAIALSVDAAAIVSVEDVDIVADTAIHTDSASEITVDEVSTIDATHALSLGAAATVALNAPVNGTVIGNYYAGAEITTTDEAVANAIDAEGYIVTKAGNIYRVEGIARTLTYVTGAGNIEAPAPDRVVDGTVINFTGYTMDIDDYTFAGWYAEPELVNPVISLTLTEDVTVYAKFTTTLKFDTRGGSAIGDVIWDKGATADLTQYTPTRTNYDFGGWYTDAYCTVPAGDSIVMDVNKTVYAGWTAQTGLGETNIPYTIEAEARLNPDNGEKVFNAGETIYVDYTISSTATDTLGSFQFEIEYDTTKLDLVSIEGALSAADGVLYADMTKERVSFDVDGNKPALDITGGKLVATAVFTAKADVEGDALVGLDEYAIFEVTPLGYDKNKADIILVDDTVVIKNIIVTFKSGDNAIFTVNADADIPAKVNYNVAGFIEVGFKVPADKLEAADGYRLCADTTAERLWLHEETGNLYTSYEVTQIQFTENATFIAQVVATADITIVAGANGTVEGTTTFTVDAGTTLDEATLLGYVTPVPNPGYVFDKFDPEGVVTADTTITALFKDGEYILSENVDPAIATITGVTDGQTITHGTSETFQVVPVNDNIVEVGYIIDGVKTSIEPDANGDYVIPGDAIIGNVEIYVLAADQFIVSFVAGDNGSMSVSTTATVNKGEALKQTDIDTAKANAVPDKGYKFVGFAIDDMMVTDAELLATAIYTDVTVEVIFDHQSYILTDVNGNDVEVTHGTDYTFTPEIPGKIVINVTGTYETETGAPTVTKNADGSYTVVGDTIIDNITLNPETIDGTIRFILNRQYRAIYGGHSTDGERKIAVLETAKLAGEHYEIIDAPFLWSERYNAYVHVVDGLTEEEGTTAAMIVSQLRVAADDAEEVDYSGDMNSDGNITVNDAMIITDMLHQKRLVPTSEKQVLMADVVGSVQAGEERVSTADVDEVRTTARDN